MGRSGRDVDWAAEAVLWGQQLWLAFAVVFAAVVLDVDDVVVVAVVVVVVVGIAGTDRLHVHRMEDPVM